ncbi:MAG TPA: class II glutamine amidotransferase [Gemmatimonadales bacterium]|jgi:predicted glutamine amidotransferase
MCRFLYYQGPPITLASLVTEPEHSLVHQSFHAHEREEPLNGDGFGVAWYGDPGEPPALFRSVSPAWSNMNLVEIARVTRSPRILAHVRAATQGIGVAEANCHPFRWGSVCFMHNGDVGGFHEIRRPLLRSLSDVAFDTIRGTTDSEHVFALVVDELQAEPAGGGPGRLAAALTRALRRVLALRGAAEAVDHVYFNAVLTDGRDTVACRFTTDAARNADTLYVHRGRRYEVLARRSQMVACEPELSSLIVSSEPLSDDAGWDPLAIGNLLLIDDHQATDSAPVDLS